MGSGGPQGLQILWSGASGVRGGFDSHAFPPQLRRPVARIARGRVARALALALPLLVAAGTARAQVTQDSSVVLPGVRIVGGGPRASTPTRGARAGSADSTRRRPWHAQPRYVMARSLLVPGWGQTYNHAWLKAVAVAAGEGVLGARIVSDQRRLDQLLGELARVVADTDLAPDVRDRRGNEIVNEYNHRLDQRLSRQWMLGAVIAYALVDAYVDAHFRGFDLEFKTDPALPNGPPPTGGDGRGVRLGLRRHF